MEPAERMLPDTAASIGAAMLAFAATARSIGAARSRAMSASTLRSRRESTSFGGRAVPASAAELVSGHSGRCVRHHDPHFVGPAGSGLACDTRPDRHGRRVPHKECFDEDFPLHPCCRSAEGWIKRPSVSERTGGGRMVRRWRSWPRWVRWPVLAGGGLCVARPPVLRVPVVHRRPAGRPARAAVRDARRRGRTGARRALRGGSAVHRAARRGEPGRRRRAARRPRTGASTSTAASTRSASAGRWSATCARRAPRADPRSRSSS